MLDILNKPEQQAINLINAVGLKYRVVKRDGIRQDVFLVAKSGYDLNRINLTIDNGFVTEAHVG